MLTRKASWDTGDYGAWITQVHLHPEPFAWGKQDCCLFAADGVQAITGVDIAQDFRGNYTDQTSAFALIKSITGGTTVADAAAYCATKYGMQEWKAPLCARRGDLVAVKNNDGQIIAGIVSLNGRDVLCMSETGVINLSIRQVVRAWKVG